MNKATKIILVIAGLIFAFILGNFVGGISRHELGNFNVNENAYYSGVSYATSSLNANTATSLLVKATSSRSYARICNRSTTTIDLYKQSTSTGIVVGMGNPIYATSSNVFSCATYDASDPYLGQIWGIASQTSTVSVESVQQ